MSEQQLTFLHKTKEQIRISLIELMKQKTGLTSLKPDGVLRGIIEANLDFIFEVSSYQSSLLNQIDLRKAEGQYLDMHAARFATARNQPTYAFGSIAFTAGMVGQVQKNAYFKNEQTGLRYQVLTTTPYTPNTEVAIPVRAEQEGSAYNVKDATAVSPLNSTPALISAYLTIDTNGTDAEDDEKLRTRLLQRYLSLIEGPVSAKFIRILHDAEKSIIDVSVDRTPNGFNTVDFYVKTNGAPLTNTRLRQLKNKLNTIDALRATSVEIGVKNATPLPVHVTILFTGSKTQPQMQAETETALETFFASVKINQDIEERDLYHALSDIQADTLLITAPNKVIQIDKHHVATLSSLSVQKDSP